MKYIDPYKVHVEVPNPDDPRDMPIYEGPANEAHKHITTGQYTASVEVDGDESVEVMLHVWTNETSATGAGGNSNVYKIPDAYREHQWSPDYAERVARVMTEIFGFESDTDTDGQVGVTFTVGTVRFTIGESMTEPGSIVYAQDMTDVDHQGFAQVIDETTISDTDMQYRGQWSPWEAARQFVRYAVPAFGRIAEKRAAHADHTF